MSQMLDRITEVSMVVRGLAKDLGVTTIGMSQLNRETSKAPETPRKEGLMGGSPLENDAEQVLLLDHSRIERVLHGIRSWAVLDKNRHGEVVEIPTFLNTATLELRERLPDEISLKESA
jgi:replicative DNA helicase